MKSLNLMRNPRTQIQTWILPSQRQAWTAMLQGHQARVRRLLATPERPNRAKVMDKRQQTKAAGAQLGVGTTAVQPETSLGDHEAGSLCVVPVHCGGQAPH
jgi:hypothetical protein